MIDLSSGTQKFAGCSLQQARNRFTLTELAPPNLGPNMRTTAAVSRFTIFLSFIVAISSVATTQSPKPPNAWMCTPGELIFSDDFDPATVSDRWFFKAAFALRDGALVRTNVEPTDTKRVFLKEPSFHNTVIQFDFKLAGQTTDLRLVTGSGGHYNSVTQIHTGHFQINTPVDRDAGLVPAQLGECIRNPHPDQWQSMTVEYWEDEIIAHLSDNEFVLGKHPIIDRTREHFAFQFDLPGASIDNVRVWQATSQRDDWAKTRSKLAMAQANRQGVKRSPTERYKIQHMNLKSRLTLNDPAYRDLVAKYEKLQSALHADYPEAFITHKQIGKVIAKKKQHIKATDPNFKVMETLVHKARRAEYDYVLSTKPELARLKQDGVNRNRYPSELGLVRAQLEVAGDKQLVVLVAETARRQTELEARYPEAFQSVDAAVEKRNAIRKSLNDDSTFQARNKVVVESSKAIKQYEYKADPNLAKLEAASKAYLDTLK